MQFMAFMIFFNLAFLRKYFEKIKYAYFMVLGKYYHLSFNNDFKNM